MIVLPAIIELLHEIMDILQSPETDFMWAGYDTPDLVVSELGGHLDRLAKEDLSRWRDLEMLFAPTGPFQEISISHGWGHHFLDLAARFDELAGELKKEGRDDETDLER
jgi:hypothetical protein